MYVCMYPRTKLPKLSQPTHSDEETREREINWWNSRANSMQMLQEMLGWVRWNKVTLYSWNRIRTNCPSHLNLSRKKWKRRKKIRLLCLIATIPRGFCTETQLKSSSTTLLMISSVIRRLIRRKTPLLLQLRWTQK